MGEQQSRSSYMAHRVLTPIFGCPYVHLLSQLTLIFHALRVWPARLREITAVGTTVGGVTDGAENMSEEHQPYTTARCPYRLQ